MTRPVALTADDGTPGRRGLMTVTQLAPVPLRVARAIGAGFSSPYFSETHPMRGLVHPFATDSEACGPTHTRVVLPPSPLVLMRPFSTVVDLPGPSCQCWVKVRRMRLPLLSFF